MKLEDKIAYIWVGLVAFGGFFFAFVSHVGGAFIAGGAFGMILSFSVCQKYGRFGA